MQQRGVAVVTGAGGMRSIGRAVALRAASDGYDVIVSDIERPSERIGDDEHDAGWSGLPAVVEEIEAFGRRAHAVVCDLSDADEVGRLVGAAIGAFGRVDALVNTARAFAVPEVANVVDLDVATWDHVNAVNVRGPMLTSQAVARVMVAQEIRGRIVNVSSLASHKPTVGAAPYCCSKAALDMLKRVLALELGPHGIHVNAVNPGQTATNRVSIAERARAEREGVPLAELRARVLEQAAAANPLRRVGQPDDVADVVAFLLSDDSRHVNGQCIDITGGP